ncbi:MAG: hypothetical protein FWF28_06745, partial [Micrococcales bacterium]|nr:hypothetical protein [Micrococcales bacterium]
MIGDAFGIAALRAAVLEAWRASPARFREDANTEEDYARGYYRDRVLVELAQNAADAARRADVPGHLLLRLTRTDEGAVLVAANTGEPLSAAGVASLASMRASAKRDGRTVGHFGVGFAATRSVSDEIAVRSTSGAVRFSLAGTAAALEAAGADVPALAGEVRRRDGSLPALRLPWPDEGTPPLGYDTAVVALLRDDAAAAEVAGLLAAVDDTLLLALPGLVEIVIEDDERVRRIADAGRRWLVTTASGELPLALFADRPVEERAERRARLLGPGLLGGLETGEGGTGDGGGAYVVGPARQPARHQRGQHLDPAAPALLDAGAHAGLVAQHHAQRPGRLGVRLLAHDELVERRSQGRQTQRVIGRRRRVHHAP